MFPFRWMLHTGFPRSKTVTLISPSLQWADGMEWLLHPHSRLVRYARPQLGKGHTPRYAWGQCLFHENGQLRCMAEGFPVAFASPVNSVHPSPPWSYAIVSKSISVRPLLNLWNQEADIDYPNWTLTMKGRDGIAQPDHASPSQ